MKRTLKPVLAVLILLLLIAGILSSAVYYMGTNVEIYAEENRQLDTASRIGMSQEDLDSVTRQFVQYVKGEGTLDMRKEVYGEMREVFNEREKSHMVDVQNLFRLIHTLHLICLIAFAVCLAAFVLVFKRENLEYLLKFITWGILIFLIIALTITAFAIIDFTTFWDTLHTVFFTNDLWLLDPKTDILIQIMPEQFFVDFAMQIGITAGIALAFVAGISAYVRHRIKRKSLKTAR